MSATSNSKGLRVLALISRILLGLIFLIFGLNGFFQFIPIPPHPGPAGDFMMGMVKSGYFVPFFKTVEVICAILLLVNVFVPLALVVLAPIIINILLFHVVLEPATSAMSVLMFLMMLVMAWYYRDNYRSVLVVKA